MKKAADMSDKSPFNEFIHVGKKSNMGILTSGVSYNYVKEAAEELKLDVTILKLGMTHPIPPKMIKKFLTDFDTVVVVEELEPILEDQIHKIAHEQNIKVNILGKSTGHFSRLYEYNPDIVTTVLANIFDKKDPFPAAKKTNLQLPSRPPALCPGCPHRATYYAVKQVAPKDTVYPTDIGCYTLGKEPPLQMADLLLCMGSNAGTACGLAVSTDQKIISYMGDSTFFHSGIPPIINAVHHNHDVVITVLDNRTTAMTGHQPHPGTETDGMGEDARRILVEDVVKGCGVEHIEIVNPNNVKKTSEAFKRALDFKGTSVVVSKAPCILLRNRDLRRGGRTVPTFEVDQGKCSQCETCLNDFGCPAFYKDEDGRIFIDEQQCNGCGNCLQVCPKKAIKVRKEEA
jgi:indolepyruvate ferredoxin oxidoreductase alpha subunit